jgi:hypothetical protein
LSSSTAGGKPNSSQGGIDHVGYKNSLYEELDMITKQLATAYSEPYEVVVEGFT